MKIRKLHKQNKRFLFLSDNKLPLSHSKKKLNLKIKIKNDKIYHKKWTYDSKLDECLLSNCAIFSEDQSSLCWYHNFVTNVASAMKESEKRYLINKNGNFATLTRAYRWKFRFLCPNYHWLRKFIGVLAECNRSLFSLRRRLTI